MEDGIENERINDRMFLKSTNQTRWRTHHHTVDHSRSDFVGRFANRFANRVCAGRATGSHRAPRP
ncbi:hypothetical protein ASF60_09875 [Methylobacterium sp. Leaf113]|uniref:hypothetical protein n=1 Tax=Methylobacterium sp. Leaf113 TaxID=1736259 RepID=UPI0006FC02C0|nr:hypothetical protein [Methylobacterium sp. Leaf113]KQP73255.1 hypothetical protein ASF60_09875 [Methylobacterium sp. Leaf113]